MMKTVFIFLCAIRILNANAEEDALKLEVTSALPTLDGWCSKEKALAFIDLILAEKPKVWVEVGVFGGSSLFPVLSTFKFLDEGMAIAIDAWDKIECIKYFDPAKDKVDLKWWGNINLQAVYRSYLNMINIHGFGSYVITMRASSEEAAEEVQEIDVLHLDGNHCETPSLRDAELFLPKVRSGGYIWMNDSLWTSRQKAVDFLLESCDVVKVIDQGNCLLLKKR